MAIRIARCLALLATGIAITTTGGVVSAQAPPPAKGAAPVSTGLHEDVPPLPAWPDFDAPPRYRGPSAVRVRVATDRPGTSMTLLERTPEGWRSVCTSPCTTEVDGRDAFALGGWGAKATSTFRLTGPSSVLATPVTDGYAHIVYFSLGGFFVVHGGAFYLAGSASGNEAPGGAFRTIGTIELVAAVPMLILGMYESLVRSSVTVTPDAAGKWHDAFTTGLRF
jgi:hypothetical protein